MTIRLGGMSVMQNSGKSEPVQVKSDESLSEDILILYLKNKIQKFRTCVTLISFESIYKYTI